MPEEKKRFIVRPGARVEVGIAGDAEETRRPSLPAAETPRGALAVDDEDEPLLRRLKKGALLFFDLGTRLRSVPASTDFEDFTRTREPEPPPEPDDEAGHFNEYLEIEVDGEALNLRALVRPPYPSHLSDDYGLGTNHVNADAPESLQSDFDAACLGSLLEGSVDAVSPLDTFKANGSARELPACAPVPFVQTVTDAADYHESDGYPTEAFDFTLYNSEKTLKFPNTTFRESVEDLRAAANDDEADEDAGVDTRALFQGMDFLKNEKWKEREHEDGEGGERWNPHNLTGGEAKRGAEHSQKGQGGRFNLKLDSRLIYEPFDTGDAENFKVTREPDFEAEEVPFGMTGKPSRVFLRPQLLCFGRAEDWSASVFVAVESHTWRDEDDAPVYVHHRGENQTTTWHGAGFIFFNVVNAYDPAATPQTFTLTLTKTGATTATLDGAPNGSFAVTGGAGDFEAAPGITVGVSFDSIIPNGTVATFDVVPAWTIFQVFVGIDAAMIRGMHVGRWPVLPRAALGGWDSLITFAGEVGYEYDDALSGGHFVYDPATAATKTGRAAFAFNSSARMRQVYDRHASRDSSRLVYQVFPLTGRQFFITRSELGLTEEALIAIRGTNTTGGVYADAATVATLEAQAEADAQEVAEGIAALLGATARNPLGGLTSSHIDQRQRVVIVPPYTVPAGVLCGIVEHGSAVFYVWRKTPETRGGFDPDRNQGAFPYPFIFPYV